MKSQVKGFTLIELMIVVAIVGIISAIAIPSYIEYIRKGKRTDAKVELLRLAQLQESYFVQNLSYAQNLTTGPGGLGLGAVVTSEQGEYTMSISSKTPGTCNGTAGVAACTAFTLTATRTGSQGGDTRCGDFTLTNTGVKGMSGTVLGGGVIPPAQIRRCWK